MVRPSATFKQTDADSYDAPAESFDRLSRTYTAPFASSLVAAARLKPGDRVLDLGSGTGIVSRLISETGAWCVGADLSQGMLRVARNLSPAVPVVQMDGEAFALQARTLDAVVSLYSVMHFPDPSQALGKCCLALKPGGVLALAFGAPAPWPGVAMRIPRAVLDDALARTGRLLRAPQALEAFLAKRLPPRPAATETSLAGLGRKATAELLRLTRQAGFAKIQSGWRGQRFEITSPEEFWELQAVFSSTARKQLATLDAHHRRELRTEFIDNTREVLGHGGSLIYQVGAGWIRAVRP